MLPASQTFEGITVVNNGDGSCTFSGTSTDDTRTSFNVALDYKPILNHIYLALPYSDSVTWKTHLYISWLDSNKNWVADFGYSGRFIKAQPTDKRVYIKISINFNKGIIYDNFKMTPLMFDLTEMYGAGNEPTTVKEFRKDFPDEYYEYSPKCFETMYRMKYKVSNVCQVLDKSKIRSTNTVNGITFTTNSTDGSMLVNGTTTAQSSFSYYKSDLYYDIKANHKYLMTGLAGLPLNEYNYVYFQYYRQKSGVWYSILNSHSGNLFFTAPENGNRFNIYSLFKTVGFSVDNVTIHPQLFDLTEMYGAGNEPTTVEAFRKDFPDECYEYSPNTYLTMYSKKLVTETNTSIAFN